MADARNVAESSFLLFMLQTSRNIWTFHCGLLVNIVFPRRFCRRLNYSPQMSNRFSEKKTNALSQISFRNQRAFSFFKRTLCLNCCALKIQPSTSVCSKSSVLEPRVSEAKRMSTDKSNRSGNFEISGERKHLKQSTPYVSGSA